MRKWKILLFTSLCTLAGQYASAFSYNNFEGLSNASLVGTTQADFRVDESGQANISIPILTPPGTAGVVPQLSLNYNSGGRNGVAGLGCSIQGTSAISRCPRTEHQDGYREEVRMDDKDAFCLNG